MVRRRWFMGRRSQLRLDKIPGGRPDQAADARPHPPAVKVRMASDISTRVQKGGHVAAASALSDYIAEVAPRLALPVGMSPAGLAGARLRRVMIHFSRARPTGRRVMIIATGIMTCLQAGQG